MVDLSDFSDLRNSGVDEHPFSSLKAAFAICSHTKGKNGAEAEWLYLYVNPVFESLVKCGKGELSGKTITDLSSESMAGQFLLFITEHMLMKGRSTYDFYSKDGKNYYVGFFSVSENQLGVILSEAANAPQPEKLPSAVERKYKRLFSLSNDGLIIFNYEGIILEVNEKICEILNYRPDEMTGRFLSEFRYDKDHQAFHINLHKIIHEGYVRIETRWIQASGDPIDLEIIGRPLEKEEKTVLVNIRDISERKKEERKRREYENRLKAMFEQSAVGIAQVDTAGRFLDVNPRYCEICGYSSEELKKMTFLEFTHPDDRNLDLELIARMVRKEVPSFTSRKRYIHKNGSGIWINRSLSAVRDDNDHVVFFIAIVEDITEQHLSEELLRVQEEKLRRVMEDQTEFLIRWKPDGRILFVNKAYCDYYQVLEKNIIGSNIFDTLTKEEGLRLRTKISGISLSQSTIIDNHPVQRKDGSIAWHQWTDRGIFDQDGKVVEIQSIGFDISDLVETRNKLHLQNLFFEYLFNNAPFAIAFLDNRDHILDVNPAFVRQFSYEKDEVLGKPINSLIIPPGYSEEAEYISGRVVSGFSEDRLTKRMTKDGRLINVKILGRPVVRGGERLGIFAIYQDISESIENEARMKRNEKRLQITLKIAQSPSAGIQELLDYAIQGALDIMECNYGFIYEYKWELNRAEVTAWSESVRRDCPMYVTGEQKIFTPTVIFLKVLSEGKPIICNDVNSTLNPAMPGLHIPIHNYILVPVVYEGHVAAVLGLANRSNGFEDSDAAELTLMMDSVWKTVEKHKVHLQLQEALVKAEESEKLKSSFLAVMSHELRTPLNAIIGFSSLIDESWPLDEIIEYVKTIEASGNHLLSLINDMFHLSALEAGQLQASQEVISLNRLFLDLRDLVLSLQKLDNKPELEIRYVPDPYHPDIEITSDSQKLQEVLINLIRNAIKFTHSGEVEYGFRLTDSELILYVRDTGIGIPEQHSEIIFQKFRQGDEGSSRTHGGLGIGLTLARDLTELLGGKISFQSVVDEGTTFFVKFKAEDLVPSIADIEEVSEKNVSLTGKRILIAEDEDSNFKLLESILMPYKVVIERVFNGEEAVQKIVSGVKPDIILMDLKMPVMDGYEATRRIRMLDPLQPIIAQTAYAMTGDREKALLAGCNDYICKPLNRAHLLEIIQNLLNNRMKTGNSHPSWIND